jgi:hypothetical protein
MASVEERQAWLLELRDFFHELTGLIKDAREWLAAQRKAEAEREALASKDMPF